MKTARRPRKGLLEVVIAGQTSARPPQPRLALGSGPRCDIVIPGAAELHCFLSLIGDILSVQCLEPLEVNGETVSQTRVLGDGDRLSLGDGHITWRATASAPEEDPGEAEDDADRREQTTAIQLSRPSRDAPVIEASEAVTQLAPTPKRLTPRRRAPQPPDQPDDAIIDLVSATRRSWFQRPSSWIALIIIIAISSALATFSFQRRRVRAARAEVEELRAEMQSGGLEGVQRKVKALLGAGHALTDELTQLRDALAVKIAAAELQPRPRQAHDLALTYRDRHERRDLSDEELSALVSDSYTRRLDELGALIAAPEAARRVDALRGELAGIQEAFARGERIFGLEHRSLLRARFEEASAALEALDQRRRAAAYWTRQEQTIDALLARRDPVAARRAFAALEPPAGARSLSEKAGALLQRIDRLESEVLRFRGGASPLEQAPDDTLWLRPVTRYLLKRRPPILDRETPVFFAGEGMLLALDPDSGAPRWSVPSDDPNPPRPIALETRDAYAAWTRDGAVRVVLPDGAIAARCQLPAPLSRRAVVVGDKLYAPAADGIIYVVDLETGQLVGRHSLTGALAAPLGVDETTGRVVALLEHDLIAILRPDPKAEALLLADAVSARLVEVPPLLLRSYLLTFENTPDRQTRMRVFTRGEEGFRRAAEYRLEGWVLRPPVLLNARLAVTTDEGCVYPFTINTVDAREGVTANFDEDQSPRRLEGETLVVTEMVLPNFLYFGGRKVERKILNEQRGWWTRERLFDRPSLLPGLGIAHRPFQILEDRLLVTSIQEGSDALCLSALTLDGVQLWQSRQGLPSRAGIFGSGAGFSIDQSGAITRIPDASERWSRRQPVLPPLIPGLSEEASASPHLRPLHLRRGAVDWFVRPGRGTSLEAWLSTPDPRGRTTSEVSDFAIVTEGRASLAWARSLPAEITALDGDGEAIAAATLDGGLHLLARRDGRPIADPFPFASTAAALSVNAAERRIVVGAADGSLRLYRWDQGALTERARARLGDAAIAALVRSGDVLWAADQRGAVIALALDGQAFVERGRWRGEGPARFALAPDGRALLAAGAEAALSYQVGAPARALARYPRGQPAAPPQRRPEGWAIALRDGRVLWFDDSGELRGEALSPRRISDARWSGDALTLLTAEGLLARRRP